VHILLVVGHHDHKGNIEHILQPPDHKKWKN
jgi:hypothetical protein